MKLEARGYANRVEVKTSKSGKVYTTFSLGVKQKEKAYGNNPEKVTWANFNVTDFSGTDVTDKAYVTVSGFLKVRDYNDKEGNKRQSLDIVAETVEVAPPVGAESTAAPAPTAAPAGTPTKEPWDD